MTDKDRTGLKGEFLCLLDDLKFQATPRIDFTDQVRGGAVLFKHHLIWQSWSETGLPMGQAWCMGPTKKFRDWVMLGIQIVRRREAWHDEIGLLAAKVPTDDAIITHPLFRYAIMRDSAQRDANTVFRRHDTLVGNMALPKASGQPEVRVYCREQKTEVILPGFWPDSVVAAAQGKSLVEIVGFPSCGDVILDRQIASLKVEKVKVEKGITGFSVTLTISATQWLPIDQGSALRWHEIHPFIA